jgi:5'-nucleotidase
LKIVLTNDDGIDAPGIRTLTRCVQDWGHIFIVAPADPQSGIAHRVTTRSPGANLGSDVYNSGTVAAAREAAILGCRAIAISQYIARDKQVRWDETGQHAKALLKMLLKEDLPPLHFWNVNLPHASNSATQLSYQFCRLDTHPHKYDYRKDGDEYTYDGSIHDRPRDPGTDVAVCFDKRKIAITRIAVGSS